MREISRSRNVQGHRTLRRSRSRTRTLNNKATKEEQIQRRSRSRARRGQSNTTKEQLDQELDQYMAHSSEFGNF